MGAYNVLHVTVVHSYICSLLVKRAGSMGEASNSDDECESVEGEEEARGADS